MDATRFMTTAALAVAMASLFAPPVAGLMSASSPPSRPASGLEVSTIAQDVERASLTGVRAPAALSCEPTAPTLAVRAPRIARAGS